MSDIKSDPLGLGGPAVNPPMGGHHWPEQMDRINKAQELALGAVPYVGLLIGIFGMALLWMMLAPNRQRLAVDRLRQAPITCFVVGFFVWSIPAIFLAFVLIKFGETRLRGQILLGLWVFFWAGAGYAVCARALGERLLSDRGPVAQTALGLTGLVMPLFTLIGLPVLLISAPLGVGAWLTAGRKKAALAENTPTN